MQKYRDFDRGWISIDWERGDVALLNQLTSPSGWITRIQDDGVQVALESNFVGTPPKPLGLIQIHGTAGSAEGLKLGRLVHWEGKNLGPKLTRSISESAESHASSADFISRLQSLQYSILASEPMHQPSVINDRISRWLPELHGSKSYLVEVDTATYLRPLSSARLLYRRMFEPELFDALKRDDSAIQGGFGLMPNDVLGAALLLRPLLTANCPNYSGVLSPQLSGSIVFLFPSPMRYPIDAWPTNLHQMMKPSSLGAIRLDVRKDFLDAPTPSFEMFSWWIQSWNQILAQLLDPSIHSWPKTRTFAPDLMIIRYYSLMRLLVCVQETLNNTAQDEFVRLNTWLDSMDLISGLGLKNFEDGKLAHPGHVQRNLLELEEHLAPMKGIGDILLPRCRSACQALISMRDGFVTGSSVHSRDSEVANIIRQVRNLKHGSNDKAKSGKSLKALINHKVDLAPELADLAWFHMVRILCFGNWKTSGPNY